MTKELDKGLVSQTDNRAGSTAVRLLTSVLQFRWYKKKEEVKANRSGAGILHCSECFLCNFFVCLYTVCKCSGMEINFHFLFIKMFCYFLSHCKTKSDRTLKNMGWSVNSLPPPQKKIICMYVTGFLYQKNIAEGYFPFFLVQGFASLICSTSMILPSYSSHSSLVCPPFVGIFFLL